MGRPRCSDLPGGRGPAVEALLATTAIPAVLPPVAAGETLLTDGGVAANTPVAAAVALGARRIVVLPTGTGCAAPPRGGGALGVAVAALTWLVARQLVLDLEHHAAAARFVVVPPLCPFATALPREKAPARRNACPPSPTHGCNRLGGGGIAPPTDPARRRGAWAPPLSARAPRASCRRGAPAREEP